MSMPIQRLRRGFLGLLGGGSVLGAAGCLDMGESVSLLAAGSLATTVEDHVGPAFEQATDIAIHGEYFGSNAVMRMVEDGTKHPDVVVSADAKLLRDRLLGTHTDWAVTFASNVLGIGYDPDTTFGSGLAAGDPWYERLRAADDGAVAVGDPDLDPLGYRAWQAFGLAEREHDLDGFRDAVWESVSQQPEEPQLLAGVESGARAGAIIYENMAVDHGVPFTPFPPAYNFADPARADHYATAEYTFDEQSDGETVEGRPILYNATVLDRADSPEAGTELVAFLADNPDLLEKAGLATTEGLPSVTGNPPEGIAA